MLKSVEDPTALKPLTTFEDLGRPWKTVEDLGRPNSSQGSNYRTTVKFSDTLLKSVEDPTALSC